MKLKGAIDKDGNIKLAHRSMIDNWAANNRGKQITLEIKVNRKKRSNDQNEYYWAVIVERFFEIFNNAGWDVQSKEEVHEMLKDQFNREDKCNQHGEVVSVVKSTTKNNTFEQEEYHERCRRWASEFWGEYIPLPNEGIIMFTGDTVNDTDILIAERI